jgi:hypothetical protein
MWSSAIWRRSVGRDGADAVGSTPEALDALIKYEERARAEVIRTANLTIQ